MQTSHLQQFKQWYADYVCTFSGDDPFVRANLKLKEDHTARVCQEMNALTQALQMPEPDRLLAETIALFHDVGRHEQFSRYRTFADLLSVPHGPLGVDILRRHSILDTLTPAERDIVQRAIELHGIKQLPPDLPDPLAPFARLIRDADKLDIFWLTTESANWPLRDPDAKPMINWFPEGGDCTPEVIQALLHERPIDYLLMRTSNDMKLLELAWVFDLNFRPTLEKVRDRRYLEKIIASLPDTPDIRTVAQKVLARRDRRIDASANS